MNNVIDINTKLKDFGELLNKIDDLDNKSKQLWKEIYENAITDRQNSYAMFIALTAIVKNASTEFAVHGRTISSYLERMSKANDQLLKLADLILHVENKNADNTEEMFKLIAENNKK